jgi:hypothetical protein
MFLLQGAGYFILLTLWVDDFLWISDDYERAETHMAKIKKQFKLKQTEGKILGMNMEFKDTGIFLYHADYIRTMCAKYDLGEFKSQSVPIVPGHELIRGNHDLKEYRAIIGSLIHTSVVARPDIS